MPLNVFITGGTTGIGLSLAKYYLQRGHRVGVCGRDLKKLDYSHPNLVAYEVDVKDRHKLIAITKEFSQGHLDLFIANAGRAIANKACLPDFTVANDVIDVNVKGMLNSFEAALSVMLPEKQGHIVGVASVAGMLGLPGAAAYCASKAAVLKLCESYSLDLRKKGISVTTIAPGFIDTPLTQKNAHKMPWLMDADRAAAKMAHAIERNKMLYTFPWQMNLVVSLLSRLPRSWYRFLMGLSTLNYNKNY